jgi:nucleoside-diphosphate-sugar epimerase
VTVLVTGATGFVGTALVHRIVRDGRHEVRAAVRHDTSTLPAQIPRVRIDLDPGWHWGTVLADVSAVVHLAARVHVMHEAAADPLGAFRRVNVDGTLNMVRQAAAAGVRRLVYVSSVKVNGETGSYTELDAPAPEDPYAISKLEAEVGLRRISAETGLEVVIVRPPLVYGPGVRANFAALVRAVERGTPLPLGAVHNRRSLIAVDNLVDFIVTCLDHPAAANETFLVSDGQDLSTSELIRGLATAMGRPARLIPVPTPLLMAAATLVGKRAIARRLLGSLQVDIAKARQQLSWVPPVSVHEGLRRAVASA